MRVMITMRALRTQHRGCCPRRHKPDIGGRRPGTSPSNFGLLTALLESGRRDRTTSQRGRRSRETVGRMRQFRPLSGMGARGASDEMGDLNAERFRRRLGRMACLSLGWEAEALPEAARLACCFSIPSRLPWARRPPIGVRFRYRSSYAG